MSRETPLHHAKGSGSSHSGTGHFLHQRLTALALIPLTIWFVYSVASLTSADHATVLAFFKNPIQAGLMLTFVLVGIYHMTIGMQVIIEDYIHGPAMKFLLLFLNTAFGWIVATGSVLAVLKMAL